MTMTTHVMQLSLMIEPVEVDNLGRSVARGEKLIELGNSWFSANII